MTTLFYRPTKSGLYTQGFGVDKTKPNMLEFYKSIGLKAHNGLDIATWYKEPCYMNYIGKAKLVKITDDPKLGIGLTFLIDDHNGTFQIRFWHFASYPKTMRVGQYVDSGTLIGHCDSTGLSTGDHLHFDLKKVVVRGSDGYETLNKSNGYYGAISPDEHWKDVFIKDYVNQLKGQVNIIKKLLDLWKLVFKIK